MSDDTLDIRDAPSASASGTARTRCPQCDALYDTGAAYCPRDGAALETVEVEDPFVGRVLQDMFEIRERIGAGGMGAVYRAVQRVMDRDVAVKVLHRDRLGDAAAARRFLLEAKATSRLTNQHTVTVFHFGETADGVLYIAMEYLRGRTLREHLRRAGRLSPVEAAHILDQVAESLEEAHAAGIVHRDLKPDNVVLLERSDGRPFVKVLDFGIARARDLQSGSNITRKGHVPGTPAYMSPEAIQSLPVDGRSDLYALGVMLFELVSGRAPFRADTPLHVMQKHVVDDPPALARVLPEGEVPAALSDFVRRCLSKKPDGRPRDASDFRARLAEAVGAPSPATSSAPPAGAMVEAVDEQEPTTAREDASLDTGALLDSIRPRRSRPLRVLAFAAGTLALGLAAWLAAPAADDVSEPSTPSPAAASPSREPAPADGPPVRPPEAPAESPSPTSAAQAAPDPAPEPTPDPESEPEPTPDPEPEPVQVELRSTPPGAVVLRDGDRLGLTPLTFDLLPDAEPFRVTLRRPGYLPATATLSPGTEGPVNATLSRRPAPEPEPKPSPARAAPEPEPPAAPTPDPTQPEPEPPSKLDQLLD